MAARSCHECFSLWLFLFPFRCWVSMMQACKSLVWPKPAKYHISCLEACKFLLVTVLSIQSQLSVTGSFQAAADAHTRSSIPRASKIKPDRDRQHFMRHYLTDVLVSLCPPLSLSLTQKHSCKITAKLTLFPAECSTFSFCFLKWRENIFQLYILFRFVMLSNQTKLWFLK